MPSNESINRSKKRRLIEKKRADMRARMLGKSDAITPDLMDEMALVFGVEDSDPNIAQALASEHEHFENTMTPSELEQYSDQTVVSVSEYFSRGRNYGYVMVVNELKMLSDTVFGAGFPGGRVRLGENPIVRLEKEKEEETGLQCQVLYKICEHRVGEEGHIFSAYKTTIVGGRPQVRPTKDEPIIAIIYIDEPTLKELCSNKDARIKVKVSGRGEIVVGVLRSHRLVFLEYLKQKYGMDVATEVAHV